eukprot:CAMPEP_0195534622 /NCGR_PEP_ID=MMETSP0794_2-20130614/42735_1 /TAXON_ID=515487 /ORGANISM="Stephanopyxis turris, Strain CCMP 815" /LENGTH=46 /DNA_ID= /DNA_START= /DNA_END= /DNA_ORIENTATION=
MSGLIFSQLLLLHMPLPIDMALHGFSGWALVQSLHSSAQSSAEMRE